jgi:hypothetical protein
MAVPTEDNYIDWTLSGIREYFERRGFRVETHSVGQRAEKHLPVDRLIAVGKKILGLQFKRPNRETPPFRFDPTPHQHRLIAGTSWIYYCLPDFTDRTLQEVALWHCRFVPGTAPINGEFFSRWGNIADRLLACTAGLELRDEDTAAELMNEIQEAPEDAYVIIDRATRKVDLVRGATSETS